MDETVLLEKPDVRGIGNQKNAGQTIILHCHLPVEEAHITDKCNNEAVRGCPYLVIAEEKYRNYLLCGC